MTDDLLKKIIDARTGLGLYLAQMTHFFEDEKTIHSIIDWAIDRDYKKRLCQIYTILGAYYSIVEDNFSEASKAFLKRP